MNELTGAPILDWAKASALGLELGDAYYILDDRRFETNFSELLGAFRGHYPNTHIGYSYKTNYIPHLCKAVQKLGGYAEVVSEMEYDLARRLGVPGERIIFNGPYKSKRVFGDALKSDAIVNLDSSRDLELFLEIAQQAPERRFGAVLRCNFELKPGALSRFGFDVDDKLFKAAVNALKHGLNTELSGLHCHFPDRDRNSYGARAEKMLSLAREIFGETPPRFLNMGGGFFGHIPQTLKRTFGIAHSEFSDYAEALASPVARAYGKGPDAPRLFIEPGTALVANTMRFLARVIDVKTVRGHNFATTAGSIFNISPVARNLNLPLRVIRNKASSNGVNKFYDVVGYTCIEGDFMTKGYEGVIETGDFVEYSNIGSYSVVMKPPFILPSVPIVRFDHTTEGQKLIKVKNHETMEYIFQNFNDFP